MKYRAKIAKNNSRIYAERDDYNQYSSIRCVVLDMSSVTHLDSSGVAVLREVVENYSLIDVPVFLASCSPSVYDFINQCEKLHKKEMGFMVFATIHDAVFFAQRELVTKNS